MCTSISFVSKDKNEIFGRTQEYSIDYDYAVVQFPRNYEINQAIDSWVSRYSVLGVGIREEGKILPAVIDGVNEHGLAAVTQYFADEYRYSPIKEIEDSGKKPIVAEQFIFYLLSMCKDTFEVETMLASISIPDESIVQSDALPQHFFVKDAQGRGIVIEPSIKLGFRVFENEVGVMTNSPSFDWHLENLRNYTFLSDHNAKELKLGNLELSSFGKGSGLLGLPGDYTSPSRFVRAAALLHFSEPVDSVNAVNTGFHLLDTSDIVKGVIKAPDSVQYTQYTSIYNLTKKEMHIRLYENFTIQKVSFDQSKADAQQPVIYDLVKEPTYQELKAE